MSRRDYFHRKRRVDRDVELVYDEKTNENKAQRKSYTQGKIDDLTGQRAAFPINDGHDEENVEASEVLKYLAQVRKEQSDLPPFITCAPAHPSILTQQKPEPSIIKTNSDGQILIHQLWLDRFLQGFEEYRNALQAEDYDANSGSKSKSATEVHDVVSEPDPEVHESASEPDNELEPTIPETVNKKSGSQGYWPNTMAKWRRYMLNADNLPEPSTIQSLPYSTTLKILKYCGKWCRSRTQPPPTALCIWTYALLARLADTLTGEELGLLRQLARNCNGAMADEPSSSDEGEQQKDADPLNPTTETNDDDTNNDRARLLAYMKHYKIPPVEEFPLVVTAVVGVMYRQHDLYVMDL